MKQTCFKTVKQLLSSDMMKKTEIIEILKQMNPLQIENDGPTSVFLNDKRGKKTITFALSVEKDIIIVTTGKYFFKRKYRINKNEL